MLAYYLRLAILSLKRNRVLTALMIAAIALGIGMSMTSLTVFYSMSGNPIAHKNDRLYVPQLDNWDPQQPFDEPNEPPNLFTYRDAIALIDAHQAKREVVMLTNFFPLQPENRDIKPFMVTARLTVADFFPMFEPPLKYGGGWDASADKTNARVIVLSEKTNEKAFGGENSIGRKLKIGQDEFTVVGVLADWHPTPKFYDVTANPFTDPEDVFLPFRYGIEHEMRSSQNNSCWKDPGAGYAAILESDCIWLNFWVELEGSQDRDRYKAFLDGYVAEQKKLGRFPRPLNNRLSNVNEWLTTQHVVRNDTHIQVALSFGFLLVCMVNTLGLLLAKFMGRAGEIGLRRALGASKRTLFAQFLVEAGIVGVCGGVAGLAITWAGLIGVRHLYSGFERLAHLDWMMVGTAIGLAVAAALLAGLLPTWRACQVAPAAYLKTN